MVPNLPSSAYLLECRILKATFIIGRVKLRFPTRLHDQTGSRSWLSIEKIESMKLRILIFRKRCLVMELNLCVSVHSFHVLPSEGTRVKLAPANESEKHQLQRFCNACKGIPQVLTYFA